MKDIDFNNVYTLILISAIIAPIISTVISTFINNIFQLNIRKKEMKHDEIIHSMEINKILFEKHMDFYVNSKHKIFHDFIDCLAFHFNNFGDKEQLSELYSSACKASSLCSDSNNRKIIMDFVNQIPEIYGKSNIKEFEKQLNSISNALQSEFSIGFTHHIENMQSPYCKR